MTEQDICSNLYKEGLITYDKYLDCIGDTSALRTANISDMHKYAISSNELNKRNIYDKQVYIYNSTVIEPLYLSVIDGEKLTLTSGIINKDDASFIIEKTGDSIVSIKNYTTNKYIKYDIPSLSVSLSDNRNNKTDFTMKTYLVSSLTKYKFILLKNDGSETDYSLVINKDNKLVIEKESDFYWDIENLEHIDISELDTLLLEINEIKRLYNETLEKYNYLYGKKSALEYIINSINENMRKIFSVLLQLQRNMIINITERQLEISKRDTLLLLDEKQIQVINNKIKTIEDELAITLADLEMYNNQIIEKTVQMVYKIETKSIEIQKIKQQVSAYNNTLMNNNIVVDINSFLNSNDENSKEILKSEINKEVANTFNNKKTRFNLFYMIIICILILVIILQLTSKLLSIKKM
jgi:hypothetical protein